MIEPSLDGSPESFWFSPKESEQWRREQQPVYYSKQRKTPVFPCKLRNREKLKGGTQEKVEKPPAGSLRHSELPARSDVRVQAGAT